MFARTTTAAAYVCLRCQAKSSAPKRPKLWSSQALRISRGAIAIRSRQHCIRWQSSAAAAVDPHDVNNNDDIDERIEDDLPVRRLVQQPQDQVLSRNGDSEDFDRPFTKPERRIRHFKPIGGHELGLNMLGKPANIIVLDDTPPTEEQKQKRRKPRIPPTRSKEREPSKPERKRPLKEPVQINIRDSIAQETAPLGVDHVNRNIDLIREQLHINEGTWLDKGRQWQTLWNRIKRAFTKPQLMRYMLSRISTEDPAVREEKTRIWASEDKPTLASRLLIETWQIRSANHKRLDKATKKTINIDPLIMDVITRLRARDIDNLRHEVHIEIPKNSSAFRVDGRAKYVEAAIAEIKKLETGVMVTTYNLSEKQIDSLVEHADAIFHDVKKKDRLDHLLAQVSTENNVILRRAKAALEVLSYDTVSASNAYRQLITADKNPDIKRAATSFVFPRDVKKSVKVPIQHAGSSHGPWSRYIVPEITPLLKPSRSLVPEFAATADKMANHMKGDHSESPTWTAHLAELSTNNTDYTLTDGVGPKAQFMLRTSLPLLRQYLNTQSSMNVSESLQDLVEDNEEIYRLVFSRDIQDGIQIELCMTRPTLAVGEFGPLRLRQVKYLRGKIDVPLLLPSEMADLRFSGARNFSVWDSAHEVDPAILPLLSQIAAYMNTTSNYDPLTFNPVFLLDPTTLRQKAKNEAGDKKAQQAPPKANIFRPTNFILTQADHITRSLYEHPILANSQFFVEHLTLTPLPSSLASNPRPRQELRITSEPLLHVPKPSPPPKSAPQPQKVDYNRLTNNALVDLLMADIVPVPPSTTSIDTKTKIMEDNKAIVNAAAMVAGDMTRFARAWEEKMLTKAGLKPTSIPGIERV